MTKLGEPFELLIAAIQQKIDPAAKVTHNEILVDRLEQRRQFDVVIRGKFAGQSMLGIIECKDTRKRVGTPEVDAFCTKAQDVNANFKIIASKSGFTEPAIKKARHYGIKLVSLLDPAILGESFPIGDWWVGRLYRWGQLAIYPFDSQAPNVPVEAPVDSLSTAEGRLMDWLINQLRTIGHEDKTIGWVVNFKLEFESPIALKADGVDEFLCSSIAFHARRDCEEYEYFSPLSAEALVDWHTGVASIPANTTVSSTGVPSNMQAWSKRDGTKKRVSAMLDITLEAHEELPFCDHAPKLEALDFRRASTEVNGQASNLPD